MQNLWIEKQPTVLLVTHDLKEAAYLASRICVMQARPGRIVDDRAVPFARPRTIDVSFRTGFRNAHPALALLAGHGVTGRKSSPAPATGIS